MSKKLYARIEGIYCEHCVETVSSALKSLNGIENVSIKNNVAEISGDDIPSSEIIAEAIRNAGYETDECKISEDRKTVARTVRWYEFVIIAAVILLLAYALYLIFGYNIFNAIPAVDNSLSYGMLFFTGLLTSIHCLSMCGAIGIFASAESNNVRSFKRPLLYNAGRITSYTAIGALVGLAGSVFSLDATRRGVIVLIAAVFMLFMSLSMMGIISFHLPRFLTVNSTGNRLGAFVIGLLNGFMPCGPLQAMQIYALSTGSFWRGALSMALFALGTVPLMLVSGAALNLSRGKAKIVVGKIAAVLMLILAVSMLNRGLTSLGVNLTNIFSSRQEGYITATLNDGVQTVEFDLDYDSFADIVVQKGVPVKMIVHADSEKITGCNNEIVSREFGFDLTLSAGDNIIEFTPDEEGEFVYSCWMDMISNHIKVIDDPDYFK